MVCEIVLILLQNMNFRQLSLIGPDPLYYQYTRVKIYCSNQKFRNEQAYLVNPVVECGAAHLDSLVLLLEVAEVAAQDGVAGVGWGAGGALVVLVSLGRGEQGEACGGQEEERQ